MIDRSPIRPKVKRDLSANKKPSFIYREIANQNEGSKSVSAYNDDPNVEVEQPGKSTGNISEYNLEIAQNIH